MKVDKSTEKKIKYPADAELALREIVNINIACAQVQMSSVFGGKLHYDITKLSKDSESVCETLQKSKQKIAENIKKMKLGEREEAELIEKELTELLDSKEKIRMPLIKTSDLYAARDYKAFELKEGDALVTPFFMKVMWDYLEHDKKFD